MSDYLIHWGIKGQRKGIRRFQNEDGSLTPEGRERYRKNFNKDITLPTASREYRKIVSRLNRNKKLWNTTITQVYKYQTKLAIMAYFWPI